MASRRDMRLSCFDMTDRITVITGAASGIGLSTAELFADLGARVVIADLNGDAAREAAASITKDGGSAVGLACDVADEASVAQAFRTVLDELGPITCLVNNAAGRTKAAFMDMSVEEWDRMHHICTRGTFLCSREAIRQMIDAGQGGTIVNISTVASIRPMIFNNTHYDSAKAGVNAVTRDCAIEFASHGIRVNAIMPGGTDTPGGRAVQARADLPARGPALTEGRRPMNRRGQPIELAQAILFMASPASSYVTGQILGVDGGYMVS